MSRLHRLQSELPAAKSEYVIRYVSLIMTLSHHRMDMSLHVGEDLDDLSQ